MRHTHLPLGIPARVAVISDLHVGPARDASFTQSVVDDVEHLVSLQHRAVGEHLADDFDQYLGDIVDERIDYQITRSRGLLAADGGHVEIAQQAIVNAPCAAAGERNEDRMKTPCI